MQHFNTRGRTLEGRRTVGLVLLRCTASLPTSLQPWLLKFWRREAWVSRGHGQVACPHHLAGHGVWTPALLRVTPRTLHYHATAHPSCALLLTALPFSCPAPAGLLLWFPPSHPHTAAFPPHA